MDNNICVCLFKPVYNPDFDDSHKFLNVNQYPKENFLKYCCGWIGCSALDIIDVCFSGKMFVVFSAKDSLSVSDPLVSVDAQTKNGKFVPLLAGKLVIVGAVGDDGFFTSLTEDEKAILMDCSCIAGDFDENGDCVEYCSLLSDNII